MHRLIQLDCTFRTHEWILHTPVSTKVHRCKQMCPYLLDVDITSRFFLDERDGCPDLLSANLLKTKLYTAERVFYLIRD